MSGLTRLCGSISGYVSNSRSPALAFIVLCSVVKERCDRKERQLADTRLPKSACGGVEALQRCVNSAKGRRATLPAKRGEWQPFGAYP